MKKFLLLIALVAVCTSTVSAAPIAWPVRVSANGRYFVDQKDRPVFWLGTTQWELFRGHRLEEAQLILDKSKDKGFVFVQTMLVGVGDGGRANVYGQKPWLDDNPLTPNEAYFRNVDAVIQAARERDLILYLMPYHQTCRKHITVGNARPWAKWLAQRYKEVPNIVWSLIPEAKPEFVPILRELAAGLREGDGGVHLITVEPDPSPYSSSFVHSEAWLDFNSIQTWKGVELIYPMVTHDYNLQPVKPVLMAEGAYEQGSEYGFEVSPLWVRRQAYYSYLAGGHHAYGHNDSWRILPTWKQALDAPGARQMGILRRVFEARPQWWRLVPDQSLFAAGGQTKGRVLHLAARHPENKWAMTSLADPVEFSVNLAGLVGASDYSPVRAFWVNPATGESEASESSANTGVQSFRTPAGWEDSLLILESAGADGGAVPPGAAALGYTKCVINEKPTAADITDARNGDYKWFSGQWWSSKKPPLSNYSTQDGVLALSLGGDLVSAPHDFSTGKLPLLPGRDGFYVEFEYWLSDSDPDYFPAVWLMPAEHNGARQDHYAGDPPGYERWMELDVDEGGFGPGLTGTVHSSYGIYEQKYQHIQNPNNVSRVALDRTKKHIFGAQLRSPEPDRDVVGRWRQTDECRLAPRSGGRSQAEFLPDHQRPEPRETETILPVRQRREGLCPAELAAAGMEE